jgi:hypothetical protein
MKAATKRARAAQTPRAKRLVAVEQAIREKGWSFILARELATEWGVSVATLYQDRQDILTELASQVEADLPVRRQGLLLDLRAIRARAVDAMEFAPAARLLAMEAQIEGLDRPPAPPDDEEEPEGLAGVLVAVRRLRRRAEADGSYVAAARLLAEERAVLVQLEEERRAKQKKEDEETPDLELEAKLARCIRGMTRSEQTRLRALLDPG